VALEFGIEESGVRSQDSPSTSTLGTLGDADRHSEKDRERERERDEREKKNPRKEVELLHTAAALTYTWSNDALR
jgi:hypothetical protein